MIIQIKKKASEILGVTENAEEKEIRLAYYRLAKNYHPDLNGNDESKIYMFKLISEAYEVLTNPKNNHCYVLCENDLNISPDQSFNVDRSYCDWWIKQFGELI